MVNDLKRCSNFGKIKGPPYLKNGWIELIKKAAPAQRALTSGVDGITIDKFKENVNDNLKAISKEIVSNGSYKFSTLKPVFRPKENGTERLICIPTVNDRIVQKSIQLVLLKNDNNRYLKFNGINFGFVKKKSVNDAISKAINERNRRQYVFKTDISSFFDNIDRSILKEKIRKCIKNKSLHELLFRIVDSEIDDSDKYIKTKVKKLGIKKGVGVRQGMPLSPLFANLFLYDLDNELIKKQIRAVRYADDLLFFANTEEGCRNIFSFCKQNLAKIDLDIPDISESSKSQIYKPTETVDFLGMCISLGDDGRYFSELSNKQKGKIKNNFMNFSDLEHLTSKNITLRNYGLKIKGIYSGYCGVYGNCQEFEKLQSQMRNWALSALRQLLLTQYGIKYDLLNKEQKKFLDII